MTCDVVSSFSLGRLNPWSYEPHLPSLLYLPWDVWHQVLLAGKLPSNTSSLRPFPSYYSTHKSVSCDMSNFALSLRLRIPRPHERGSPSLDRYDSETSNLALDLRVGSLDSRDQELEARVIFCLLCVHTYRVTRRLCIVVWVALSTKEKSTPSANRGVGASSCLPFEQTRLHLTISVTPDVSYLGTTAPRSARFVRPEWENDRATTFREQQLGTPCRERGSSSVNLTGRRGTMSIYWNIKRLVGRTALPRTLPVKINEQHPTMKCFTLPWAAVN